MRPAAYRDEAEVARQTAALVASGHSILQIHKLAANDEDHVAGLLDLFAPPVGALVLDAGCGVGRVAELMARQRPDLRFVLLNIAKSQLDLCASSNRLQASFDAMPVASGALDAVMFNYSLGHGDLRAVLAEAARALRPGGVLFVYDMESAAGERVRATLDYTVHPARALIGEAQAAGFSLSAAHFPPSDVSDFLRVIGSDAYQEIFAGVRAVAYRFVKERAGSPAADSR